MPTYQYRCTDCSNEIEAVQKFTDDPLTDCPACYGDLRKVFSAVGVVFKGSGFYATDNRPKGRAGVAKSEGGGSEKPASSDKPASDKPAASAPATSGKPAGTPAA